MSNPERHKKLEYLEKKQNELIRTIVELKDLYGEEPESNLLLSNIKNASDQILKIRLRIAMEQPAEEK